MQLRGLCTTLTRRRVAIAATLTAAMTTSGAVSARLGALACQRDSMLRTLRARVLAITSVADKKARFCEVFELDDTVLFPEGGGQPFDTGLIDDVEVISVNIKDGKSAVTVNWARRFDHMLQHSAQHLLSAIATRARGRWVKSAVTLSWCRWAKKKTERVILADVLKTIEDQVNERILEAVAVAPRIVPTDSSEYAQQTEKFAESEKPEVLRVVTIGGLDKNPCCGTHVKNLAQLQALRILNVETARGASCVWFLAGKRVSQEFSNMFAREQLMTKLLSCGPAEHYARVDKVVQAQKSATKQIKTLTNELAGSAARDLRSQLNDAAVVRYHRTEGNLPFLLAVEVQLSLGDSKKFVCLSTGDDRGEGVFVIAGPGAVITANGKALASVIDGKGGGRNGVLQGKAKQLGNAEALMTKLHKLAAENEQYCLYCTPRQ
ncbi:TPA: hypothetical protein N0F65_005917 [Lagenidium giganteum]|uniref:Threonyl/alanyl tRNA synthetase SAD domain-containing protein n=1 Tax=Lagenidium giganteum TaxID=4803 RepID=A0AAV2ZAG5_9STRA|nr:TPA: hypothetical protein N0F65_005917 [Lagenidium giganteum]